MFEILLVVIQHSQIKEGLVLSSEQLIIFLFNFFENMRERDNISVSRSYKAPTIEQAFILLSCCFLKIFGHS